MNPVEIKAAIEAKELLIAKIEGEIADLRAKCPHPNLTKKHGANTGNWCRLDDCYWTDFNCPDCGKRWREDGSK